MTKIVTSPYDVLEYLRDEEDIAAYLEAALEDGDPELIAHVKKEVIRAREHLRQRASWQGTRRSVFARHAAKIGVGSFLQASSQKPICN